MVAKPLTYTTDEKLVFDYRMEQGGFLKVACINSDKFKLLKGLRYLAKFVGALHKKYDVYACLSTDSLLLYGDSSILITDWQRLIFKSNYEPG